MTYNTDINYWHQKFLDMGLALVDEETTTWRAHYSAYILCPTKRDSSLSFYLCPYKKLMKMRNGFTLHAVDFVFEDDHLPQIMLILPWVTLSHDF